MFTGLVEAIGVVRGATRHDGGIDLDIEVPWTDIDPGESIAVDGACLTAVSASGAIARFHVVTTSLERTLFGGYTPGRRVNLERALRVGDRMGGHIVQGHVDGIADVRAVTQQSDARLIDLVVSPGVADVSVPLGSITVDGVSMTINRLDRPDIVQVSVIPFTLEHTTLGERRPGDRVHVEGDTVGKYVRQMVDAHRADRGA